MVKAFEILADGKVIYRTENNHQRLVKLPIGQTATTLTLRPLETYGSESAHIFSFDF